MHITTNSGPNIESWRNTTICASYRKYCITTPFKSNNFIVFVDNFLIKCSWYDEMVLFSAAERHANPMKTRSVCQREPRAMVPHRPMVAACVDFMVTRHYHGRARCSKNKVTSFVTCRWLSARLQYHQCASNGSFTVLHRSIHMCLRSHTYIHIMYLGNYYYHYY